MNIFNSLNFIAAAIILIWNKEILDYMQKTFARKGKSFDRRKASFVTLAAVGILIIRGLLFNYFTYFGNK